MQPKRGIGRAVEQISSSTKGMSPLIATVLLIAFAVALGAMIINLGSGPGDNGPDCSKVSLAVPTICYAQNMIKMNIQNTGVAVESITLKASDEKTITQIELKNSKLGAGSEMQVEAPFLKSSKTSVSLIASVNGDDYKPNLCDKPAAEIEDLKDC